MTTPWLAADAMPTEVGRLKAMLYYHEIRNGHNVRIGMETWKKSLLNLIIIKGLVPSVITSGIFFFEKNPEAV